MFSVLLPCRWSSGEILSAAIDVKALVSVQQFCWVPEGMCMVSLISRWWCGLHGQGSMYPPREAGGVETRCALRLQISLSLLFLWLPGAPSNTSPVPSLFPQCTFAHNHRGSRKPLHRPKYVSILQLQNDMACLFLMDMAAFEQLLPSTHTAAVS